MSLKIKRWAGQAALTFGLAGIVGTGATQLFAGDHGLVRFLGYGRCSSCDCKAFEGSDNYCDNCGHNYSRHY